MIDGVHIWRAALDDPGWPGPGQLPAPERERAAGILREDVRRRWVASRWALRRVLERYLEVPATAVELDVGEHGKPRLRGPGGPRFNLSHSEGLALVALAEREVGVDIEVIKPGRDLPALAERGLPLKDAAAVRLASSAQRPAVFYAAWARHEARLKCLGTGLGASPPSSTSEVSDRRLAETPIAVADLDLAPGYAAAVAIRGAEVGPILCRSLWSG